MLRTDPKSPHAKPPCGAPVDHGGRQVQLSIAARTAAQAEACATATPDAEGGVKPPLRRGFAGQEEEAMLFSFVGEGFEFGFADGAG